MNSWFSSQGWFHTQHLDKHSLRLRMQPTIEFAVHGGALFILFLGLHWWFMVSGQLPEASYFGPSITRGIIQNLGIVQVGGLIALVAVWVRFRALGWGWSDIQEGNQWRPWILLIVFVLTWTYASYAYNLYFAQGHDGDRLLLLVLAAGVIWSPLFLLPFILLVVAIASQFQHPLGGGSVTEQFLLVRILILFLGVFLLRPLNGRTTKGFAFLLLTLIASSYGWPGLGKLRLFWFDHGHPYLLLPAAYASGWLGFWEPERIVGFAQRLALVDRLMVGFTLLVECGALFFLWRRAFAVALLCGWIGLHIGIVAVSGIFFWKWILVNLGLLWLLWRDRDQRLFPVFRREYFLLAIVLIGGSRFWYNAVNLSWYEARVSYAYRLEALAANGQRYWLPPRFFSPYEYQFSMGGFGYLVDEPRLNITYGAMWEKDLIGELSEARTAEQVFQLESQHGSVRFDAPRAERFDEFIRTFVGNLSVRGTQPDWLPRLEAPPQLLSSPYFPGVNNQEPMVKVAVHQITSLYNEDAYLEVRDVVVREIEIGPGKRLEPQLSP